ncbi:E3 ubiquitin-protein ligase MARCHF4-like [Narcine bancroftii]|uniref:E3 ubiquitin-protein ligase MARCHF4-like n=1 Tax=Narcine bancroftii TaxID=1343680 RepID=UPI003831014C
MLRQLRLKCGCHMLFSDLKGLPLRRPVPLAPVMNYDQISRLHNHGLSSNNHIPSPVAKGSKWRPGGVTPAEECCQEHGSGPCERPTAKTTSSDEELFRQKGEERVSPSSSIASDCRSPQCRICFQGPEQSTYGTGWDRCSVISKEVITYISVKSSKVIGSCSITAQIHGAKVKIADIFKFLDINISNALFSHGYDGHENAPTP